MNYHTNLSHKLLIGFSHRSFSFARSLIVEPQLFTSASEGPYNIVSLKYVLPATFLHSTSSYDAIRSLSPAVIRITMDGEGEKGRGVF